MSALLHNKSSALWLLIIFSGLSLFLSLSLPYVGEEGMYTISSLEMWYEDQWIRPTLYGENYWRPPLLNWLIIPLANYLGWDHMLVASRLIAACSTIFSGLILYIFVHRLFKIKQMALLAAAIYLSGDVLFFRGWLAYADPLFAFCVFASMACLWLGAHEKKSLNFILAGIFLSASFLTKAITGYVGYGLALIILGWLHPNRRFLLSPFSIMIHALIFLFPLGWEIMFSQGTHGEGMLLDILTKFNLEALKNYVLKIFLFPLDILYRFLPSSLIAIYFVYKQKKQGLLPPIAKDPHFLIIKILSLILILNCLPFWFAPQNKTRYLLPFYPFFAIFFAYLIYRMGSKPLKITINCLIFCLVFKYIVGIFGFPYYQNHYRGNYKAVAKDIIERTQGYALCCDDDSATGLSTAAELDILRLPEAPLKRCHALGAEGFILAYHPERFKASDTFIHHEYLLGRNKLFLLCKGKACE